MTSLVGHSGSGKSTILNLIPRFYDAEAGDIIIDNQSIYKSSIQSIRKEISMVSQETTLFDDTILNSNNIYVIDSGRIIDSGKHEDLISKSQLYKSFYEKQIQK